MGAPDHLAELMAQLRAAREAQRLYFQKRTTPALDDCRAKEFAADGTCRAILTRRHMFAADVVDLARAWGSLRGLQKQYFQRKGDAELREAKHAERAFDELLDPPVAEVREPSGLTAAVARSPTLFDTFPTA